MPPNSEPPSIDGPVEPRGPLSPKPDQAGPETVTPTGAPKLSAGQRDEYLTTSAGARPHDTDHQPVRAK